MMHLERYDRAITAFVPSFALIEPDEVRENRRRLMAARDYAAGVLCHQDQHVGHAATLARIINDVASSYCYGKSPDLGTAVAVCRRLLSCANTLDRIGGARG